MAIYFIEDQTRSRTIKADIDEHEMIGKLVPSLVQAFSLPPVDIQNEEIMYLLSYDRRFLLKEETLASARVPEESILQIIGIPTYMGAVNRHPREWHDYDRLKELHALNADLFDMEVMGEAFDGAPLGYVLTFKGIAGPVVDESRIAHRTAIPLLNPNGTPVLCDRFVVEVRVIERYPFIEPQYLYQPPHPLLCHPHVNPVSRDSCLFYNWRPFNSLVDVVERIVTQISYLGFDPATLQTPQGQIDEANIHLLNRGALSWVRQYLAEHPGGLPFRNAAGQAPPALKKPDSSPSSAAVSIKAVETVNLR